jgi:hypothetical protein
LAAPTAPFTKSGTNSAAAATPAAIARRRFARPFSLATAASSDPLAILNSSMPP